MFMSSLLFLSTISILSFSAEFIALQRQIEYVLNGDDDSLTVTVNFHQGIWIQIDNEWTETDMWCDKTEKHHSKDCVQIRLNSITETICLQSVLCFKQAHYICEVPSRKRFVLEGSEERKIRNLTKTNNRLLEKSLLRIPPKTTRTTKRVTKVTTKRNPNAIINNAANVAVNGINAVGQVSNAISSVFGVSSGGNTNQNPNLQTSIIDNYNDYNNPQALSSNEDEKSSINWKSILFIGSLIIAGIIFLSIITFVIFYFFKKNKTMSNNRRSAGSMESALTSGTYE
ncbi:hypothetical protein I4U23_019279 [Adineta vaga]|nr:hypothetical protein I4U23_019279 [Adineta vaga]